MRTSSRFRPTSFRSAGSLTFLMSSTMTALVRKLRVVQAIGLHRLSIMIECEPDSIPRAGESLGETARTGEKVDHRRALQRLDPLHLGATVIAAEIPEVAPVAERLRVPADGSPVLDQVHVKRVPKWRRDELREDDLELLVIERFEREAELTVRAESCENAPDVRVGGKKLPAE